MLQAALTKALKGMDGNICTKKNKTEEVMISLQRMTRNKKRKQNRLKDGERRLATERAEACDSTAKSAGRPEEEKK